MEEITQKTLVLFIIGLGILGIIAVCIIAPPAHAEVFIFGSAPNYSVDTLPNNSYVHQGENITQGNFYDLSGIYGFSGEIAHWGVGEDAGIDEPDVIIKLSHPRKVYIDPSTFPVGEYYQWDGKTCTSDGLCTSGFGHGNAYVFAVTAPLISLQEQTVVHTANITVMQDGERVEIPVTFTQVETYYGTPVPTSNASGSGTIMVTATPTPEITSNLPKNMDAQDQNGIPIAGGVSGAVPVTVKSSVGIETIIAAIVAVGMLVWRRTK